MNGADVRGGLLYAREYADGVDEISYAWTHGALDAMEAEAFEEPEPACAGYDDQAWPGYLT